MCFVTKKVSINGESKEAVYYCGGSLIAPGVILTTAHYFEG